jgi:hypothetical protein
MTATSFEARLADAFRFEVSQHALERLDGMVAAGIARRRPARRWKLVLLATAALVAVPLAAVATAGIRTTEDPFGDVDAAAFRAEIDAAKQVVPLPQGAEWPAFLKVPDENASYSRNGGRFWVESVAFCVWIDAWVTATNSGNAEVAATDRDTILAMPTWQFYSSPFADQSYRDVLDRAFAGVEARDPAAARTASNPACP